MPPYRWIAERLHRRPATAHGIAALSALILLAVATDALARGGGGGNFGGGGGGGGRGGGGGDGLGAIVYLLIRFAIEYPAIGVPLLIIVVVGVVMSGKRGKSAYTGSVIRRGRSARESNLAASALSRVRSKDAEFDQAEFLGRVRLAFGKVQSAWCAHDLGPIRPFVSDGVHERFSLQIEEQKQLGYRDRMDDLEILSLTLAQATFEGDFDVLTVGVRARCLDYRVSLEDGRKLPGSEVAEVFGEYWTFMRRTGAETRHADGLMEGNCPNCGAGVELNQSAKCDHCSALLRSGEYDWVLVEITQQQEWQPSEGSALPGVSTLRRRDPHFSLQQLEDKASVLFWRWQQSLRQGDVKPLGALASERALALVRSEIAAATKDGRRTFPGECGVGRVEAVGVLPGDDMDRAVVEVRWQGTRFFQDPGSPPVRGRQLAVQWHTFVFERAATAQTHVDDTFSSAHCHNCGAPESGGEARTCEYCGAPMEDPAREWVLVELGARYGEVGQRMLTLLRELGGNRAATSTYSGAPPQDDAPEPVWAGVLAWMAEVAAADGHIDAKERAALERVAQRAGVRASHVEDILSAASRGASSGATGDADVPRPENGAEARIWLVQAARVGLADGTLDRSEIELLNHLGRPHGLLPADVRLIVNEVRSQLFQEAKQALAQSKRRQRGEGRN